MILRFPFFGNPAHKSPNPDLPFLGPWSLVKAKENHPKHQGIVTPSEPRENPGKQHKTLNQGISLVSKDQGNPKHQGMEDQGRWHVKE